ncbi:periplasmic binding protein-like I [Rozella allomycis CSF55]|uniref:Periplasmic binding protein-like I n=1 Tax=Rozella allomycis (strain CSF55) TaxID=988480 RepID=A0A4P9YK87_ROZAC|nr:periplasmic binding protein-like I [Rozella allomycis CSF55]
MHYLSRILLLFSSLQVLIKCLNPNGNNVIKIGICPECVDAINSIYLRLDQINQIDSLIDNNTKLEFVYRNCGFSRKNLINDLLEFNNNDRVTAIIGSSFSYLTIITSLITQNFDLPVCCGSSTSPALADKEQYPNFFRTIPSDLFQASAMASYVHENGWSSIAIIGTNDDYGQALANQLTESAKSYEINILVRTSFYASDLESGPKNVVNLVKDSDAKIILYFGYLQDCLAVLKQAKKKGLLEQGYVWIISDGVYAGYYMLTNEEKELMENVIFFVAKEGQGPIYEEMKTSWVSGILNSLSPFRLNNTSTEPPLYTMSFASCLDLIAYGIDRVLKSNSTYTVQGLINGTYKSDFIVPQTFMFDNLITPTGKVVLDINGERIGDYSILNTLNGEAFEAATWSQGTIYSIRPIYYPGGSTIKPKDYIDPNEVALYSDFSTVVGKLSVLLGAVGIVVVLLVFIFYALNRKNPVIVRVSVKISYVLLFGLALGFIQLLIMTGKPNDTFCIADTFLLTLSFSLFYSFSFAKMVRLYRLFYVINSGEGSKWTDKKVSLVGILMTLPNVLFALVWNIIDRPKPHVMKYLSTKEYYWTCRSSNSMVQEVMLGLILTYGGLILALNLIMAFKTRDIPSKFQETKAISLSVYNVTIVMIFTIPILTSNSLGFTSTFLVKVLSITYIAFFNIVCMFLHKMYNIYVTRHDKKTVGQSGTVVAVKSTDVKNDSELKKTYKITSDVSVRVKKSLSFFSETSRMVMALDPNTNAIHFLSLRRNTEFSKLEAFGIGNHSLFLKFIKNFSIQKNAKTSALKEYQQWVNVLELWQNKIAAHTKMSGSMLSSTMIKS